MSSASSAALVVAAAALASQVAAQAGVYTYQADGTSTVYTVTQDTGGDVPLASKHFEYPYLPYHADSGDGPRGTQQGYNICNSTTLGEDSWCQTGFINSVDDFCLWGAPFPNTTVGEDEEQLVAYCTTPTHGSRMIPPGALQGVQFTRTPDYVQIVGYIDQTVLNLPADDYGGEEDPHGADQRGNPLGALLYSTAFGGSGNSSGGGNPTQVSEWSYFVGSGIFCFKACDPAGDRAAELCEHRYDRIGCTYNCPADYASINGTFESCQGDDQLPVGQYIEDGQTKTWEQPPESLGPITSVGYTPVVPASSQCQSSASADLFTALASYQSSASPSSAAPTSAASGASGAGVSTGANGSVVSGQGANAAAKTGSTSNTGAAGKKSPVAAASLILAALAGAFAIMA